LVEPGRAVYFEIRVPLVFVLRSYTAVHGMNGYREATNGGEAAVDEGVELNLAAGMWARELMK